MWYPYFHHGELEFLQDRKWKETDGKTMGL
jgi:hypothetical protein